MEETYKRPSIDYPYFPGNLRRIRKEQGLTFRMLSLICEATSANLCRYEQGRHMPRIRTLESISRALGVPLNELLGPLNGKQWIGLTTEEIDTTWRSVDYKVPYHQFRIDIARAIEAKLREKNQ